MDFQLFAAAHAAFFKQIPKRMFAAKLGLTLQFNLFGSLWLSSRRISCCCCDDYFSHRISLILMIVDLILPMRITKARFFVVIFIQQQSSKYMNILLRFTHAFQRWIDGWHSVFRAAFICLLLPLPLLCDDHDIHIWTYADIYYHIQSWRNECGEPKPKWIRYCGWIQNQINNTKDEEK